MILVDPPTWPGWGRVWSHLVSDSSLEELHAFAEGLGIPRKLFDEDHYDVPIERERVRLKSNCGIPPRDREDSRLAMMGLNANTVVPNGDTIAGLNVPTGIPLVYELDESFAPVVKGGTYLDADAAAAAIAAVANQGR